MAVVTQTDRRKLVGNRCVIEVSGDIGGLFGKYVDKAHA